MEQVKRWLLERSTPLLWVFGPVGCGKTTAVQGEVQGIVPYAAVLRFSAFWPDDAIAEVGLHEERERLSTKLLFQFAMGRRLVVMDGLDAIQETVGPNAGDVTDCRLRQLLLAVCEQAVPSAIVVTSRLRPPRSLPEGAVTVINLLEPTDARPPSLPETGSLERRVLEFAALSRRAIDSATIQRMSGIEQPVIERVLSSFAKGGIVTCVNQTSYQVPDQVRSSVLVDATASKAVRELVTEALQQHGSDLERLLDLFMDDGRVDKAIGVYWHSIGNFERLHHQGRDHFGAQLCRRLNGGLGPKEISLNLRASEGVWAIMNDWSQFALCCGDARTSALAATSAYDMLPKDRPPWDAAMLAASAGQAHLMTGDLAGAMAWCERSWNHAREGMKKTEGIAVREVMEAYDWSANTIAKIYLRLNKPSEIQRLIDDLSAIHQYARQSIAEFNAASIIPAEGPSGDVTPEQLVDGRLAAMLALAERRFTEVRTLAGVDAGAVASTELSTLLLRAEISARCDDRADALLSTLRDSAQRQDDSAAECELAILAQSTLKNPAERLAMVEAYLPRAEACGLGMCWRDLQLARSRELEGSGRRDEACGAAEAALFGTDEMVGAYPSRDWPAVREAVSLLQSFGRTVADHVLTALEQSTPPERRSPRQAEKRRAAPWSRGGATSRVDMHAAALRVLEAYQKEGMPFAISFRKFGLEVLHGPFELGPKLTENALRDGLPPEVEVVTIQDHGSMSYNLGSSRFQREAPALMLEDEHWAEVAKELIRVADLIVSEPLMLSEGVRRELQMIYDLNRWDRTVLVLPPLQSYLGETVDNDSLIQMFPRCVWGDSLYEEPLTASPMIVDLLERIRAIARLPVETRCALSDVRARDKAYPIELLPIAEHLETEASLGSLVDDDTARYYGFWQMFRASAIRGASYGQGNKSTSNLCKLAHSYLEMSKIMLGDSTEGDRLIMQGDPAEAKLLVQSAYRLLQQAEDDLWVRKLCSQAEEQWQELLELEQAMKDNPLRFEIRLRYGPLIKRKVEQSGP